MKLNIYNSTYITYNNYNYSISLKVGEKTSYINMVIHDNRLLTSDFPQTYQVLLKLAPDVLMTHCFNEQGLPFKQEVINTELAHLFEHILIQKLSTLRKSCGKNSTYSGTTYWNWNEEPEGVFHIKLNCGVNDADILESALVFSIDIFNSVVSTADLVVKTNTLE